MKPTYFLCLCLVAGVWMAGCKKEPCKDASNPACDNYDPCYGKKPTSAAFKIEEALELIDTTYYFETDTIRWISCVRYTALQDADEYTWYIGSEVIKGKSCTRCDYPTGENIPITLIVKNNHPDTTCFPTDDGEDKLTRVFRVAGRLGAQPYYVDSLPVYGIYEGFYASRPTEKVRITLKDSLTSFNDLPIAVLKRFPCPNTHVAEHGWGIKFSPKTATSLYLYVNARTKAGPQPTVPRTTALAILRPNYRDIDITIQYEDTLTGILVHDKFSGTKTR